MSASIPPPEGPEILPVLPLRNSVLFPASVVPVNVGRARSVRLIEESFGRDRPTVAVVAQRASETEDPEFEQVFTLGTVARVLKVIRLSSGNYSVVLQGISRMQILEPVSRQPFMRARVQRIDEPPLKDPELNSLVIQLREGARKLLELLPHPPRETVTVLDNIQDAGSLADLVASSLPVTTLQKQEVLEVLDVHARIRRVLELVLRQLAGVPRQERDLDDGAGGDEQVAARVSSSASR
jgi:ATP-dependent Lon protease